MSLLLLPQNTSFPFIKSRSVLASKSYSHFSVSDHRRVQFAKCTLQQRGSPILDPPCAFRFRCTWLILGPCFFVWLLSLGNRLVIRKETRSLAIQGTPYLFASPRLNLAPAHEFGHSPRGSLLRDLFVSVFPIFSLRDPKRPVNGTNELIWMRTSLNSATLYVIENFDVQNPS